MLTKSGVARLVGTFRIDRKECEMDISDHTDIRAAIDKLCGAFGDEYWRRKDSEGRFPDEFYKAVADSGWLGISVPEAYGGAGLGLQAALTMLQAIAESGAGMNGGTSVKVNIFGLNPVVRFGSEEQKRSLIPPVINGEEKVCFGVTEPDVGLDTTRMKTRALHCDGGGYVIRGQKTWISTAQVADRMLLLARTTPIEEVSKPTEGLSLFFAKMDRQYVDVREIDRMGRSAVDANMVFFQDLPVSQSELIGEEGKGFSYVLHSMNPERMVVAAEAVGIGRAALRHATEYAKERIVFGRPIGQNQGIQHPLAQCWMELEAANLMAFHAADLYDDDKPCGAFANAAKYLAGEAGYRACETALLTLGGNGYAKDYHLERYLRDIMICRIAPITPHLISSYIAERELGLPRSY